MNIEEIHTYLENKVDERPDYVVLTFYELRIKLNLSEEETANFLHFSKNILENNGYKVYRTGQEYIYKGNKHKVKENELLIGIK